MKPVVKITPPELFTKVVEWFWMKRMWYGGLFDKWWEAAGQEAFLKYAEEHRVQFNKELPPIDKDELYKIYQSCTRSNDGAKQVEGEGGA